MIEFFFVGASFVALLVSFLAIYKANRLSDELYSLRSSLLELRQRLSQAQASPQAPALESPPASEPASEQEVATTAAKVAASAPAQTEPTPEPIRTEPEPIAELATRTAGAPPLLSESARADVEITLGGRVASYIGAAAVILAVAFFVGYAIQRGLLGPWMRVGSSGAAAVGLVILGEYFRRRRETYSALADSLVGAGSALSFFTVFAAHRLYNLVGSGLALGGLVIVSALVLLLARRSDSQPTAIIGTIGAFLTPWLVKQLAPMGAFPLLYASFVNLTVAFLYRSRPWHVLPYLASAFALVYMLQVIPESRAHIWTVTGAISLAHLTLIAFSFAGRDRKRSASLEIVDTARLCVVSAAYAFAILVLFETRDRFADAATPLFAMGLANVAGNLWIARNARARREATAFLHLAALFFAAATAVRFDGIPAALLVGLEGFALAALPVSRARPSLHGLALFLGVAGLCGVLIDAAEQPERGRLFANFHYLTGLALSGLIALQGRFQQDRIAAIYPLLALIGAVVTSFIDAHLHYAWTDPFLGIVKAGILLVAAFVARFAPRGAWMHETGMALLILLPVNMLIFDIGLSWKAYALTPPFQNSIFWLRILLLLASSVLLAGDRAAGVLKTLAGISAVILLTALEWNRMEAEWSQAAVSIWLGVSAFICVGIGLARRIRALRLYGLSIFGVTVAKVFLLDLAELRGLERAGAFLGLGLLLLALSYFYQKLAKSLLGPHADPREPSRG